MSLSVAFSLRLRRLESCFCIGIADELYRSPVGSSAGRGRKRVGEDADGRAPKVARVQGSAEDVGKVVTQLVRARDVFNVEVGPLDWAHPEVKSYVQSDRFDAKRFGALPYHGGSSRIVCGGRLLPTARGVRELCMQAWGAAKDHGQVRMDMPVLRTESERLHVERLARLMRADAAGKRPADCLGYCLLPWPYGELLFLALSRQEREVVRTERKYLVAGVSRHFVGRHQPEFCLHSPEDRRRFYVTMPNFWHGLEPVTALAVPKSPVFTYKSDDMVEDLAGGSFKMHKELLLDVARADHTVMVLMQFLKRAPPSWQKSMLDLAGFDQRMVEVDRGLLFPLSNDILRRIHQVGGMERLVAGTRYSPVRAAAAVLCTAAVC